MAILQLLPSCGGGVGTLFVSDPTFTIVGLMSSAIVYSPSNQAGMQRLIDKIAVTVTNNIRVWDSGLATMACPTDERVMQSLKKRPQGPTSKSASILPVRSRWITAMLHLSHALLKLIRVRLHG